MTISTNPNRNINRVDLPVKDTVSGRVGYEVRILRKGLRFNQYFSDQTYGSKTKALAEARLVRDKMEKRLKPFTRKELADKTTKRNTSGVRGVRVRTTTIVKNGKTYSYQHVEASWSPTTGTVIKKSFSIEKMGLEVAWLAALDVRAKGVAKLNG